MDDVNTTDITSINVAHQMSERLIAAIRAGDDVLAEEIACLLEDYLDHCRNLSGFDLVPAAPVPPALRHARDS